MEPESSRAPPLALHQALQQLDSLPLDQDTREQLKSLLQAAGDPQPPAAVDDKYSMPEYLVAATRASFTLGDLPAETGQLRLSRLLQDSLIVPTPRGEPDRYALSEGARGAVFGVRRDSPKLATALAQARELNDPAERNGDPETYWLARLLDPLQTGTVDELESKLSSFSLGDMTAAARALGKATALRDDLGRLAHETRRRLDLEEVLRPLRILIGAQSPIGTGGGSDDFLGRDDQLELLYGYVGIVPAPSMGARLLRLFRRAQDRISGARGALVVHAIGGMGKSAMMAKFVLAHATPESDLLFAYLDFDRTTLARGDAFALLIEIARQVALQIPVDDNWENRAKPLAELRAELREKRATLDQLAIGEYVRRFILAVNALAGPSQVFLLVLDSFERVQGQGTVATRRLIALLEELGVYKGTWPRLRVVACGRSDVPELRQDNRPTPVALPPLGTDDSHRLARRLIERSNLGTNDDWAEAIGKAAKGYPLIIRVLVDVIAYALPQDRAAIAADLGANAGRAAKVATVLYKRFADRLDIPGGATTLKAAICLRVVTRPLLAAVLGRLGTNEFIDPARALAGLSNDVTLWSEIQDDQLRWRPDLRELLLECVRDENPDTLQIAATGALAALPPDGAVEGEAARAADRLYYSLLSGRGVTDLDPRDFGPAARASLVDASEDFPEGSQERLVVDILAKQRPPLPAELTVLPSQLAWRLALDAEPALTALGQRFFDPKLPALRQAASGLDNPALLAQALRLAFKVGDWPMARQLAADSALDEPVGLEAFLCLAARDRGAGESDQQLSNVLGRDWSPAPTGQTVALAVHRLVAARLADPTRFEEADTAPSFQIYTGEIVDENLLLLAGCFGENSASWACEALFAPDDQTLDNLPHHSPGGVISPFRVVSADQWRLISDELRNRPPVPPAGGPENGTLEALIENLWSTMDADPAAEASGGSRFESWNDPTLTGAMTTLLRLALRGFDPTRRRSFTRRFCAQRDPYWSEPLGYALLRLQEAGIASTDDTASVMREMARMLGPRITTVCFSESVLRDPVALFALLEEASALPTVIDRVEHQIVARSEGWFSSVRRGGDRRRLVIADFQRLVNGFRRWVDGKRRIIGGGKLFA
jgi:hypothetical protein